MLVIFFFSIGLNYFTCKILLEIHKVLILNIIQHEKSGYNNWISCEKINQDQYKLFVLREHLIFRGIFDDLDLFRKLWGRC